MTVSNWKTLALAVALENASVCDAFQFFVACESCNFKSIKQENMKNKVEKSYSYITIVKSSLALAVALFFVCKFTSNTTSLFIIQSTV